MNLTVYDQVDPQKFFCVSQIKPEVMKANGLTMSARKLRALAKGEVEFCRVPTGDSGDETRQHMTKVFRYKDFLKFNEGE